MDWSWVVVNELGQPIAKTSPRMDTLTTVQLIEVASGVDATLIIGLVLVLGNLKNEGMA
jgi:hypothetical protein